MFVRKIIWGLLLLHCLGFTFIKSPEHHAIYISVVKIQHEKEATTSDIHIRVFKDDFKNVLRNKFGYHEISEKEAFCTDYGDYINQYFKKQFICTINETQVNFKLSNCAQTAEVYQLTFKMDCPVNWDSIQIEANYFMELFPKQSNVLHVEDGDIKRFGRATKGNELLKIRF